MKINENYFIKKYTLNVYQVYEEEHGLNIWSNPRFNTLFEFYNDETLEKTENEFYINQDTAIYYGCER